MLNVTRSWMIVLFSLLLFLVPLSAHSALASTLTTDEAQTTSQALFNEQEREWLSQNPTITFAGDPDFAPVEFINEQGEYAGIVADMLDYVADKTGLKFEMVKTDSWQQSVDLMQQGQVDLLPLISSYGREGQPLLFTDSYLDYPSVILVRNDTKGIQNLDDLQGKKVVVVAEWSSEREIKQDHPQIEVLVAQNSREAIDRLLFGHADAMIHYYPVASYELLQRGIGSLRIAGRTSTKDGAMAINSQQPMLHTIIQKTLHAMSSEEKQSIQSKWLHAELTDSEHDLGLTEEEAAWLENNRTLRVAHDQDWKPFSYVTNQASQGFSVEYVKLLAQLMGVEIEFVSGPWSQVYDIALRGNADLILDLIKTPERVEHHFLYTPPYARNPNVIVTKQTSDLSTFESLKGKRVSFVEGSFLEEVLRDEDLILSPREDSTQALKALQFGEVDAVLSRIVIARQVINENALYDLEIKNELNIGNPELDNMNIGVPKDRQLLHSILVKAMQHLDMADVNELRKRILATESQQSVALTPDEIKSVLADSTLSVRSIGGSFSDEESFDLNDTILNAIGSKVGITFQNRALSHQALPSEDSGQASSGSQVDVLIGERDFFVEQSGYTIRKPIISSYYALATQTQNRRLTSLSELKPDSVVGVVGSNQYIETLNRTYPELFFATVNDPREGLNQVASGELAGLLADGMLLEHLLSSNQWIDLEIPIITSTPIQYLMAFGQHLDKGVISALNKAQSHLTADQVSTILSQYQTREMTPNEGRVRQSEMFSQSPINSDLIIKVSIGAALVLGALLLIPILLNKYLSNRAIHNLYTNKMMLVASGVIVLVLSMVSLAAYLVIGKVEQQTRHNIQISLSGISEALNTSIDIWLDGKTSHIDSLSRDPALLPMVIDLLKVEPSKQAIKFSTVLIDLRVFFASQQALHGDRGFFIISPERINVGSMRDSNLGELNVIQQQRPELLDRVFLGETVLITPIDSDISSDHQSQQQSRDATMFIAAPIINQTGEVIAAMTLRYDPTHEFSQIFTSGRVGQSGESYAFDEEGYFLTTSRFEPALRAQGVLDDHANAILNLQMVTPEPPVVGNGTKPRLFTDDDNYTKAFLGALRDTKGSSGVGYLDYRGVPVLGSWVWREGEQFGFVTEIDEQEALKGYISTRNLIVSLLAFTVFLTVGLTGLSLWLGRRTQAILLESNEQLERSVRERTLRLTSIIDNATGTSIYLKDMDGRYQLVNKHFESITGLDAVDILDNRDSDIFDAERADAIKQVDKQVLLSGESQEYEDSLIDRHGVEHHFLTKKIPLLEEDGTMIGMFGFSTDVTELKSIQNDLELAKTVAEEATQSKSDFLANMSHEIRTPMNAIIGMSYLALQTDLNRKQSDYLNKILTASNSLLGVINDILDFSKIEAGKLDLEVIPFALTNVMDNLSNIISVKSQEKNLELLIAIDPSIPTMLLGDPLRIGQVLLNLTNNAVKFTHEGEVVVKVEQVAQSESRVDLRFSVQDSGIGMTAEQMSRLFSAFSQADSSTTRQFGGTGLGLTISKNLVELMDGEIGCDSQHGVGSTFYFDLTLDIDHSTSLKQPKLSSDYQGLRALVVDDSAESRDILTSMTQAMGLESDAVDSGMQALLQLTTADSANQPYDLILMDYKMPHMSGLDTLDSVRKLSLKVSPKVVMVTAYGDDEVRDQAMQKGVDGFLVKPVSSSSLFDAISQSFDKESKAESAMLMHQPLSDIALEQGIKGAHVLLVEDNEVNQQVAVELLELAQCEVSVAADGQQAVSLVSMHQYDAVLMDIQMPVMDGFEATQVIRQQLGLADLPIIAMTANALASDREACIAAGMNDHVAKPIDPERLFKVLNQWVSHNLSITDTETIKAEDVALPELEGFDVKGAVARFGGRVASYDKALTNVSNTLQESLSVIENALEQDDHKQALLTTHTLKGVSGNIGCDGVYQTSLELEDALRADDKAQYQMLFESLNRAAQQALLTINDYLASRGESESTATTDVEQIQLLIEQLVAQIEEYDFAAVETCEALVASLENSKLTSVLEKLESAVSNYDFDEAAIHIKELVESLTEPEN